MSGIEFENQPQYTEAPIPESSSQVVNWVIKKSNGAVQTQKQATALVLAAIAAALLISAIVYYAASPSDEDSEYIDPATGRGTVPYRPPNTF